MPTSLLVGLCLLGASPAAAAPASGPAGRLSGPLAEAVGATPEALQLRMPRFAAGAQVVVELDHPLDPAALTELGATVEVDLPEQMQLRLPVAALPRLAALPGVRHVREPARARAAAVQSEGHEAVGTTAWTTAGWRGAGVEVAVVDVGFSGWEELVPDELPADTRAALQFGAPESSRHGNAVAEVISDVAPMASLTLHSFSTDTEFVEVMTSLLDSDVQVVNASIGFDNAWNLDGTSAPSRAVDALADAGVVVTVAAGNEAQRYRIGELRAVGDGQVLLGGLAATPVPAPLGRARVSFRWNEPFDRAAVDLDLVVKNADDFEECGRSGAPQDGDDRPVESVDVSGCSEEVLVFLQAGPEVDPAGLTGWLYSPNGFAEGVATLGLSLSTPGDAAGALTVGAWISETDELASYSSRGPTEDGRIKPDVVGPSDVSTVSWGERVFRGSSAATPHAAGLAALWIEAEGGDAEEFRAWVREAAVDRGEEGPDTTWGWGVLDAGSGPPGACACASGHGTGFGSLALLLAALYRRRS